MKHHIRLAPLLAAGMLCILTSAGAQNIVIAARHACPVRFVCSADPVASEMAAYLAAFLRDRAFEVAPSDPGRTPSKARGARWILATEGDLPALGFSTAALPANARSEAFVLDVRTDMAGPAVLMVGHGAEGIRAAAMRLIAQSENMGATLRMPAGVQTRDPFIPVRIIHLGGAARRQMPAGSPFADANTETWSQDRLRAYPDVFRQFGLNGIQIGETQGYGSIRGAELARARTTLQAIARGARSLGMFVSLFQWGDCPYNEGETYSWNNPKERAALQHFYEDLAQAYGPLADHLNIHIGDPGGCTRDGCDFYRTPQEVTAGALAAFRAVNPHICGSLSTWANPTFWMHSPKPVDMANYGMGKVQGRKIPAGAHFLDATFMPGNVGIALNRYYNVDQARALVAAGRPVDIWGWYICDHEMINNITLNMTNIDAAFRTLPAEARGQIRSQSIDMCFHGWPQIINAYVAAQKMWDPQLPLPVIEREFCSAAFGPRNAAAMVDVYRACENGFPNEIPPQALTGSPEYVTGLRRALRRADTVHIAPDWKPNFALPVPPTRYVEMLTARLRLTIAVADAKTQIEDARRRQASGLAIGDAVGALKQRLISALPNLPIDPLYRQDSTVVNAPFRAKTFAEIIQGF